MEWTEYMIKMVPLRQVCAALGYEFVWSPTLRRVDLLYNEDLYVRLTLGLNSYSTTQERKHRILEAAPIMLDGIVYVPISFFDQILSMVTYTLDDKSNITFYSYRE